MKKIYFASKIEHHLLLKKEREKWLINFEINSRWLDMVDLERQATNSDYKTFWLIDEADVAEAHGLVLYSEASDVLRGALVEAGIAIAHGKPVVVVGENKSYGSWQYHPLVFQAKDMKHAYQIMERLFL